MLKLFSFLLLALTLVSLNAQNSNQNIYQEIKGHWEGSFIKNNSAQKFEMSFFKDGDGIKSLQIIEEWHPQFGEFVIPVEIDSLNQIKFSTGLGKAVMELDKNALELIGKIENSVPTIYIHLKKIPSPPSPNYRVEEIVIQNNTVDLYGHLHQPNNVNKNTAIIIVGGRGCYAGSTKYDLYAKLLRQYGISVLVYNKRGTGKSTGDCSLATIDDLASDVVALRDYLSQHPNQYKSIGAIGSSAGGWVIAKAAETIDFDFMISIVGPSTSVYEQQMQSMEYGFNFYKLPPSAKTDLIEYTNMMFQAKANTSTFKRFNTLLENSKKDGWRELLDDTDIPLDINGIEQLWVRRHNYNPNRSLSKFNKPFLAIYGEIDWIVPFKENTARLMEQFSDNRKDLLNITIAHDAEHGTETKGKYIT